MTQRNLVEKQLRKHTKGAGITPAKLASLTGIPLSAVYRRVHDLRTKNGMMIYTNVRNVKGKKQTFYRMDTTAAAPAVSTTPAK